MLDRFARGEIKRLMVFCPPQHGKSEHSSRMLPAYILGRRPDAKILAVSYGISLAMDFNRDVQNIMDSDGYKAVFPNTRLPGTRSVSLSGRARRNADLFDVVDAQGRQTGGMYMCAGKDGSITGKGFHFIIVDDLIRTRAEADSPVERDNVYNAYEGTIRTRRIGAGTGILFLNTRWHEDDPSGRLLLKASQNPDADQWTVLSLPALAEENDPLGRAEGEALWPERFPLPDLLSTKASVSSYEWASQYQQRPTARGGNAIKREWYEPYAWHFDPADVVAVRLAYDVAFTDDPKRNWTWGSLKAKMKDGSRITLWQHFGHWLNDERRRHIGEFGLRVKRMMADLMPNAQWMITLEAGVGAGVAVTQDDIKHLIGLGLPAKSVEIAKSAKPVRAISYLAATETHMTRFYAGAQLAPYGMQNGVQEWINPFFNEVLALLYSDDGLRFVGGHDDPIDAEVMADDGLMEKPKPNFFARNLN